MDEQRFSIVRRVLRPTLPLMVVAVVLMALETGTGPGREALLAGIALAGVAVATAVRLLPDPRGRELAPAPLFLGLVLLAAATPVAAIPELIAGLGGVVGVVWLLDDPRGVPGAVSRGAIVWGVPALGVGVAWASATLLPSTSAPVGVAGGLLVAALVILVYLVRRPELFDRDTPTTI
jgi:hypothetical protein